jgi:hypothetical protein
LETIIKEPSKSDITPKKWENKRGNRAGPLEPQKPKKVRLTSRAIFDQQFEQEFALSKELADIADSNGAEFGELTTLKTYHFWKPYGEK